MCEFVLYIVFIIIYLLVKCSQFISQYQIGTVPLPKSITNTRIKENIEIFDFELTDEETKIIDGFQNGERLVGLEVFNDHKYYPFGIEY